MNTKDRIQTIESSFKTKKNIVLLTPFRTIQNNSSIIEGKISLTINNQTLHFNVHIRPEYPLVNGEFSTIFSCHQIEGYLHQLRHGKICIKSPKTAILSEKLHLDIEALEQWMLKYYIHEEVDDQYEYLLFEYSDTEIKTQLLFTEVQHTFAKGEYGKFTYALINKKQWAKNDFEEINYIQFIGNQKCEWGNVYYNPNILYNIGLWLYIEEEPVNHSGIIVKNWKELEPYLSQQQLTFLYDSLVKKKKRVMSFCLIGYNISQTEKQEVHWQLIKIPPINIPVKGKKVQQKFCGITCKPQPIHWSFTKNCSYARFFGRGKLSSKITEQKILIIGIGAIGSTLACSLTRGGSRFLTLADFDFVETGNICRSEYLFTQMGISKVIALMHQLEAISPFINIKIFNNVNGIPKIHPQQTTAFLELENGLKHFDLIFDCSTDMEIAYMLDQMNLKAKVFNLSITNEAKELGVITGATITEDKALIFKQLSQSDELLFEGQGCAIPTFKASYVDINLLVNYALKNIDIRLQKEINNSFVIKTNQLDSTLQLIINEY